jgi:hypothetical protein
MVSWELPKFFGQLSEFMISIKRMQKFLFMKELNRDRYESENDGVDGGVECLS